MKRNWLVRIGKYKYHVEGKKTPGAAARVAFARSISAKVIKRQPPSNADGGWDGVTIEPMKQT